MSSIKIKKLNLGEPYIYNGADRPEIKGRLVNDMEIWTNKGNIYGHIDVAVRVSGGDGSRIHHRRDALYVWKYR